jgi:hypothetical protein
LAGIAVAATSFPHVQIEADPIGRVTLAPQSQVMVSTERDSTKMLRQRL